MAGGPPRQGVIDVQLLRVTTRFVGPRRDFQETVAGAAVAAASASVTAVAHGRGGGTGVADQLVVTMVTVRVTARHVGAALIVVVVAAGVFHVTPRFVGLRKK